MTEIIDLLNNFYGTLLFISTVGWAYTILLYRQERRRRKWWQEQYEFAMDQIRGRRNR